MKQEFDWRDFITIASFVLALLAWFRITPRQVWFGLRALATRFRFALANRPRELAPYLALFVIAIAATNIIVYLSADIAMATAKDSATQSIKLSSMSPSKQASYK